MTMTIDEFIDELGTTPRKWRTVDIAKVDGYRTRPVYIRTELDAEVALIVEHCPITAVAALHGLSYRQNAAADAGPAIGLSEYHTAAIICAADNPTGNELRARILVACGIAA